MGLKYIATRLIYADVESESALNEKKGWKQFVDEKYEGGSKMVRNPNLETKDQYPEVTMNTAMKSERYRIHIKDEFDKWKRQGEEKDRKPLSSVHELHKALSGSYTIESLMKKYTQKSTGNILKHGDRRLRTVDPEQTLNHFISFIDTKIQDAQKKIVYFTGLIEDLEKARFVETWKESIKKNERAKVRLGMVKKEIGNVKPELIFGLSSYRWPDSNSPKDVYLKDLGKDWSSSSNTYNSMTLHGYIEEMGVKCSYINENDKPSVRLKETDRVVNNPDRKEALQEMYVYQQAVFKHLGITHIDLYRGITDPQLETEPPTHGDKVQIKSRPLTSGSANPEVGIRFGSRMVKCRVPVERIFMSPISHPEFEGIRTDNNESEYVVIGSEELDDCTIFSGVK